MFITKKIKSFVNFQTIKVPDLVLATMAFGIPFTIKIGNIFLILGLLYSLYAIFKLKSFTVKDYISFEFVFPFALFFIVIISAFLSKDIGAGIKQIEKNTLFPLVIFSLIVINTIQHVNLKLILKTFSISTILSTLILILVALFRIINGAGFEVLFFHELGSFFDLHPVYIAINLCITTIFLTNEYFGDVKKPQKRLFLPILILCLSVFSIFLCASKAVIFCFTILYFIQLFKLFKSQFSRIIIFVSLPLLMLVVFKTQKLSDRFLQGLSFDISKFSPTNIVEEAVVFSNKDKAEISDLELRYIMFELGTFHLVDDGKLLFGYGIGDIQHHIDYYYMLYGLAPGWFEGYNLHNQYLQYLVTYGLLFCLLFIGYLAHSFYLALSNKNQLHLFFLILISTIFIFECLLSRNKGIVFFIFLNTLFLIYYKNENSDTRNKRNTQQSRWF